MKRIILIFIVLMSIVCPSSAKTDIDSIFHTQQTQQIIKLDKKVDSLLRITAKFSDDKNYFTSALTSQTTIFSVIITVALFLFGFVSYFRFKLLIKKYKKETTAIIDRQNKLIDSITESNKNHDNLISTALGNLSALICTVFKDKKVMVFKYSISGAKYHMLSGYLVGAASILNDTIKIIDAPDFFSKQFKIIFENDKEELNISNLRTLVNSSDENIMVSALYILNKYIEYKRQYMESKQKDQ